MQRGKKLSFRTFDNHYLHCRLKVVEISEAEKILLMSVYKNATTGRLYDASFRGGVHLFGGFLDIYMTESRYEIFKTVLEAPIVSDLHGIEFPRNHKLFHIFDVKLQQLLESGWIDAITTNPDPTLLAAERKDRKVPQVLTMKHLEAGFVVWMISITFGIFAFISEWMLSIKDSLIFTNVFLAYLKLNKQGKVAFADPKIKQNVGTVDFESTNEVAGNCIELRISSAASVSASLYSLSDLNDVLNCVEVE